MPGRIRGLAPWWVTVEAEVEWTKDSATLLACYQMADEETMEAVVLHERPVRAVR